MDAGSIDGVDLMQVRAMNPEERNATYGTTALLPDGRRVMWPSYYFGAKNGIPPWGILDANAYYGTSMANTQRFDMDMRRPLTASLDYQWAGSYPKTMWDPLPYFRNYPAAPMRSPISEGVFVRAVPQHNELGYQMVLLRDNGVPIGGTPETTPNYVFAGPVQIGYMSAVRPIARREQMPGVVPPRQPNPGMVSMAPAVPTMAGLIAGRNAAAYGVNGGGPYSDWPSTGPGWYPIRGAVMGSWPTYMMKPIGPAQLPITKPPPAQCANNNPESTMQNPTQNVGHQAHTPPWVDPLRYKLQQRAIRKSYLPNPIPLWGAALLALTGVGAGLAGGYCIPRPVRYLERRDESGNLEQVYIRFIPCTDNRFEATVKLTPADTSIEPSVLGPQRFQTHDEAFAWAVGPSYEPPMEGAGAGMEGTGEPSGDQLPGTEHGDGDGTGEGTIPPHVQFDIMENPWLGRGPGRGLGPGHGLGPRLGLGLGPGSRRWKRLQARECFAPGWCRITGAFPNPFPGTGGNYQQGGNIGPINPGGTSAYSPGGYLPNPPGRPLGTMNPEGAVCNPCPPGMNPSCVPILGNPAAGS